MVLLAVAVYLSLLLYEFIPLYRQKHWRDLWINSILFVFSFIIALLLSLGIKIPSPADPIKDFVLSIVGK